MDIKKLGLSLGAFAAGAAAWTWGARRFGNRPGGDVFCAPAGVGEDAHSGSMTAAGIDAAPADRHMIHADVTPTRAAQGGQHVRTDQPNSAAVHVPTDLLSDEPVTGTTRAPEAFRPDPTALPTESEREALRPATGPAPTLVADRGSSFAETADVA